MKLRIYPDPILRKKSEVIKKADKEIIQLLDEMSEIMQQSKGIGLAAPQVGVLKQLIVIDVGDGVLKLINPKIIKRQGRRAMEEGCLSLPELEIRICRADKVKVKALNEKNENMVIEAKDLLSTALQHEIDHLNGKLIIDYLSWPKKWFLINKLKKRKCVL